MKISLPRRASVNHRVTQVTQMTHFPYIRHGELLSCLSYKSASSHVTRHCDTNMKKKPPIAAPVAEPAELRRHYNHLLDQASRNARSMPTRKWQEMKRWLIVARYDAMKPKNISALAREMAQSRSERISFATARRRIYNCLQERDEKIKAGTWQGPPKPPR
jgi:hypothetical protein